VKLEVIVKPVFKWMLIGCLSGVLGTGCVAQKADLARVQKDLDQQMTKIRTEKKELEEELAAARAEIAESRDLISAQKADMSKMRSDLAPMNQQIKLMREEDLTSVYGQFEMTEKNISDLRKDLTSQVDKLNTDIQALQKADQALQTTDQAHEEQQQVTQTQATTIAQQVDEKNQALTKKMTEFQTALGQFKETLGSLGTDVSQNQTNIGTIQTDLTTQGQTLSAVQTQANNLGLSLDQVKETLEKSGTALGTQVELQSDQLTQLQQQMTGLQNKLNTDTQALRTFLEQDVKAAMDQLVVDMDVRQRPVLERIDALQSDMEALGTHVQADATRVQELSQSVVKLREAQAVMGTLLGKRGDETLQQAGRLSELLRRIAMARSGRRVAAGLTGENWLHWLEEMDASGFEWEKRGQVLLKAPYMPPSMEVERKEVAALIRAATRWIDATKPVRNDTDFRMRVRMIWTALLGKTGIGRV